MTPENLWGHLLFKGCVNAPGGRAHPPRALRAATPNLLLGIFRYTDNRAGARLYPSKRKPEAVMPPNTSFWW